VANAAKDTQTTANSASTVSVAARVEVDASMKPSGSLNVGYGTSKDGSSDSQAQAGSIVSGGNLTINTTRDAKFEGTTLAAGKNATIKAGGDVEMTAARNTTEASASGKEFSVGVSGSKAKAGVSVGVGVTESSSRSSDALAGSVSAGNNLTISSGKDVRLEGTGIGAGGDASISAKGKVDMLAATSTSSSNSLEVEVGVGVQRSKTTQGVSAMVNVGTAKADSKVEKGSTVAVGGNLAITSGGATTMQGTQADVVGASTVNAAGGLVKKDAVSESSSSGVNVSVYAQVAGKRGGTAKDGAPAPKNSAADAPENQPTRPRSNAAAEAPAKPSTWEKVKAGAGNAKDKLVGVKDKVKEKAKSTTIAIPAPKRMIESSSDSSATAVQIRTGEAARLAKTPGIANVLAQPAVASASQINTGLAASVAQYGSQAAVPESVKRALLVKAGVSIPEGANVDALLKQTQEAGKAAAVSGLAGASLSAEQQKAVLQSMGMGN
jgi:hypothetical protein